MNKSFIKVFCLFIVLTFFLTSCGIIVKDKEVDKSTTIIDINGTKITKEEVANKIQQQIDFESFYYKQQYQTSLNLDKDVKTQIEDSVINNIIKAEIIKQHIVSDGLDTLNDSELNDIKTKSEAEKNEALENIKSIYFNNSELKGEELNKEIEDKYTEAGYQSLDEIIERNTSNYKMEKLKNSVVADITVSNDELKEIFDKNLKSAETNYLSNSTLFISDVLNGKDIYYYPPNYRYVKQVLIKLEDEDINKIHQAKSKVESDENALKSIEESISKLNSDENYSEDELNNLKSKSEELNSSLELNKKELEEITNNAFAKLDTKLNDFKKDLQSGLSFDKLIEKYNEDPGMSSNSTKDNGYPITEGSNYYDDAFVNAAMKLSKVGDISEPTKGYYGYYIIQYFKDMETKSAAFDDFKDKIKSNLLESKQNEKYNEVIDSWIKESNVRIYKDRLK